MGKCRPLDNIHLRLAYGIAEQMMKSCNNYDYDDADDYYDDEIINWPINSTHYEPEMWPLGRQEFAPFVKFYSRSIP